MRVLVTGAAGSIGAVLCTGLVDRGHTVVGLDLAPEPDGFPGEWATVDCADPDAVDAVFAGRDPGRRARRGRPPGRHPDRGLAARRAHLARASPRPRCSTRWSRHGVTRIVYAGSNHAVGRTPRPADGLLTVDVRPRPDTLLRRRQGRRRGAAAACTSTATASTRCPPGSAASCRSRRPPRNLADLAVARRRGADVRGGADRPGPGLRGALRRLGQHPRLVGPRRRAGRWATTRRTTPRTSPARSRADEERDAVEAAHVGGPYATEQFHRPALDSAEATRMSELDRPRPRLGRRGPRRADPRRARGAASRAPRPTRTATPPPTSPTASTAGWSSAPPGCAARSAPARTG